MGERICIMKDGVIVQVGAPMEVYRNPVNTFVAGFLASPPMNLLRGRLSAHSLLIGDTALVLPPALGQAFAGHAEREVIAGMRPEDFHVKADAAASTVPIKVHAVTTEVLGPEVILVATVSGAPAAEMHIRCPRDFRATPGEIVTFHYDVSQLQLFDPETTYALKRPVQI